MKIDLEIIEKLLFESDYSAWDIGKETGLTRQTVLRYRNKEADYLNMKLANAIKLIEYYIKKENKKDETEMEDKEMIEEYLENYERSMSTEMDEKFSMFKSDVSALAVAYRSGDAYLYTKKEYIDFLQEFIDEKVDYLKSQGIDQEDIEDDIEDSLSVLNEVKASNSTVFIEKTGADGYYNY